MRQDAAEALAETFKANLRTLHADHQHARQGQGDLRPLARLRGRRGCAPPREPGRARGGRRARRGRARRLSAAVAPLLRPEGEVVRQRQARSLGPQRAAARRSSTHDRLDEARDTVLAAYARFRAADGGDRRRFFDERWIDAPVRPGKAPGAFAHPTVPSAHPYVLLNYQGKPRDVMTLAHELGHGVHQVLAAPQGRADGADAADARRDRARVRRDADLPRAARADRDPVRAQGDARREGRGHDQHGRAPDRLLQLRAQGPCRAPRRRADSRQAQRDLDRRCRPRASGRRSSSGRATRPSGPISRTSSIRRSTSTPMPSGIAW